MGERPGRGVHLIPVGVLAALLLLLVAACRSAPQQFADHARALGMERDTVPGQGFDHVVFWHHRGRPGPLHVYIDGDGRPWRRGAPSREPTPQNRLVLRLMSQDPALAVYLGRPCYHGQARAPACTHAAWTDARYSEVVVGSMAAALERLVRQAGTTRTVLIGYSGGGALAVLLAPRSPSTVAVVTVAANLDVDAWATHHRYVPLTASLDPARQRPLPPALYQRHYLGGRDAVVPPAIVVSGPFAPGTLRVIPGFDHRCCWETIWPRLLEDLPRTGATRP